MDGGGPYNFWRGFIWGEGRQFWKCTQFMRGVVQFLRQRIAILCIVNLLFNCFIIMEANPNFIQKQTKKSGWSFFPGKNRRPQAVQFFYVPSSNFCRTDSSNNKISFNLLNPWLFLNFTPFVMPAERHLRITWIFVTFGRSHIECLVTKLAWEPYQLLLPNQEFMKSMSKQGRRKKKPDFPKLSLGEVKLRYFIL